MNNFHALLLYEILKLVLQKAIILQKVLHRDKYKPLFLRPDRVKDTHEIFSDCLL